MRSFKGYLEETTNYHKRKWGSISLDGKMLSGDEHPTADIHTHLAKKTAADYSHDPDGNMTLRTYGKKGLKHTIKHFDKLPHTKSDTILHYHLSDHDTDSEEYGSGDSTLKRLKRLARQPDPKGNT